MATSMFRKMANLVVPLEDPGTRDDALHLHNAFKGPGCDSSAVISILVHRNASQRAFTEKAYQKMYSEDLRKRLSSELNGHIQKAVLLWMTDPAQRDAVILREAFTGDIDVKAAVDVLCSKTSTQLQALKKMYHKLYNVYLEHEIISHTSGDLEKMLLAYLSIPRGNGKEYDERTAVSDAYALYEAGENKLRSNKETFIITFTGRSRAQVAAVSSEYQRLYGNPLKNAIQSQTSGDFEHALVTILQCAENPAMHFAKVLHKTKKVIATHDHTTLIRVIVGRAEIDIESIKGEYQREYHRSLYDTVHSMTSGDGDYRTFLLSLLGSV